MGVIRGPLIMTVKVGWLVPLWFIGMISFLTSYYIMLYSRKSSLSSSSSSFADIHKPAKTRLIRDLERSTSRSGFSKCTEAIQAVTSKRQAYTSSARLIRDLEHLLSDSHFSKCIEASQAISSKCHVCTSRSSSDSRPRAFNVTSGFFIRH